MNYSNQRGVANKLITILVSAPVLGLRERNVHTVFVWLVMWLFTDPKENY